ncbi:toll/interleukin-1 receptor domain-containing protein [Aquibacillus halophilus]|nr:toll/interleukin-1 receptor domain-containing protein [Aquibacillus halophilus]
MHDVFISYSSKDSTVADAICHIFEENGIKCWYAGRRSGLTDLTPGLSYSSEIVKGLKETKVVVLVLSSFSNQSHNVLNEVEVASNEGKVIIPFRIEGTDLSDDMYYYVKRFHWLEALTEPREEMINQLMRKVQHVLSLPVGDSLRKELDKSNHDLSIEIKQEASEISKFLEDGKVNQAKELTFQFLTDIFSSFGEYKKQQITTEKMEEMLNENYFSSVPDKRIAVSLYDLLSFVQSSEDDSSSSKLSKYQNHLLRITDWYERKSSEKSESKVETRHNSPSNKKTSVVNYTKIDSTINGDVNAPFSITGNVNNHKK